MSPLFIDTTSNPDEEYMHLTEWAHESPICSKVSSCLFFFFFIAFLPPTPRFFYIPPFANETTLRVRAARHRWTANLGPTIISVSPVEYLTTSFIPVSPHELCLSLATDMEMRSGFVSFCFQLTRNLSPNHHHHLFVRRMSAASQPLKKTEQETKDPRSENTSLPSEIARPLQLPCSKTEGDNGSASPTKLDVSGEGMTLKLNHLGPLVVNRDGTMSRIANWAEMSDVEKKNTLRILGKRNQLRLGHLKDQAGAGDGASGDPDGNKTN